jgi:ribonuclease T1
MHRVLPRLLLLLALSLAALPGCGREPVPLEPHRQTHAQTLPSEALATLDLIRRGGPFPYRKDGTLFQNREGRLPDRPRGYYREYTVPTPGSPDRGARRIIAGGDPPREYYYTPDHYRSFRPIEVRP